MRVAIAEDSPFFRDALSDALESVGNVVTTKVGTIEELDATIDRNPPDVVILDICLPPTKTDEGLVAAERLATHVPSVGILVLSAHLGMPHVTRLLSIGRGSIGCLSKDQLHDANMLQEALLRIQNGGTFIDPQFVEARFRLDNLETKLTPRELETMRSIAQGLSNQGIATHLNVNIKTIESSITSIFRKLNLVGSDTNARVCAVLAYFGQYKNPAPRQPVTKG